MDDLVDRADSDVDRVLARRELIVAALAAWDGRLVSNADVEGLVAALLPALPSAARRPDPLTESVQPLVSLRLTSTVIAGFAHRLAGNVSRLAVGRSALPWAGQRLPQWVPFQLVAATVTRPRAGRSGWLMTCKAMSGLPAGLSSTPWWSASQCRQLASLFGFDRMQARTRQPPRYPFQTGQQFVNLRFAGLVLPQPDGLLRFTRIEMPVAVKPWNREILRCRFRVDPGYTCPFGYGVDFPCHVCSVGYAECRAAVHRARYQPVRCARCRRTDLLADPDLSDTLCLSCHAKTG